MSEHDDFSTIPAADQPDGSALALADDSSEPWAFDIDGDGTADGVHWDFSDGTWQELVDVDGDRNADVLLIDVNGDDAADIQIWDNGDGTYTAAQDADGDGEFESEQTFTRDELESAIPGIADLLDSTFTAATDTTDGTNASTSTDGEPVEYDVDGDGVTDAVQWTFADGTWQSLVDVDGDGQADVLLIDVNGDDVADIQIMDNGDGTYTAVQDADGDSVFETEQTFTRAELDAALPGITELLDVTFGSTTNEPVDTPADQPATDDGGVAYDVDGDGVVDTIAWDFGDGTWQELIDVDGDGNADLLIVDTDMDDYGNYAFVDNGDGTYTVFTDANNDGVWDEQVTTLTRDELDEALPGIADLLDARLDGGSSEPVNDPVSDPVSEPTAPVSDDGGVAYDVDGDGVVDTIAWDFGDGTWQELTDVDGDGNADLLIVDTDMDDYGNYAFVDNGDGTYSVFTDANSDGVWDEQVTTLTRDELDEALPGIADLLGARLDGGSSEPVNEPVSEPVSNDIPDDGPVAYDADGDGDADIIQWSFADGTWQQVVDVDGDGNPDVLLIDVNGDDAADIQIWNNGDGTYTAAQDADGDGEFEAEQTFTRAELDAAIPGVTELLEISLDV